ncbi:hypothetical protein HD806DRAFT_540807 [Xylariaceae sp. AK1471]|nr:hypothetical protein HD806DRAFT_540807 [Xylariaceae sp. AK1471]
MRLTNGYALTSIIDVTIKPVVARAFAAEMKIEESKKLEWNTKRHTNNSGSDPSIHSNVPDLLDPKGEPCVELMSGAMITSPDPILSDDVINPFDVLESGAQEIEDAKPFPPVVSESDEWAPAEASDYDEVKEVWKKGEKDTTIATWAELFTPSNLWSVDQEELDTWKPGMPDELQDQFESCPEISRLRRMPKMSKSFSKILGDVCLAPDSQISLDPFALGR